MAQFKVIPSREKILARIPDYAVEMVPTGQTVTITYKGTVIAESNAALWVKETKHADVIYLPRSAMREEFFTATDHSTYCPFKGHANYWQLNVAGEIQENIVWSYESPYEEVLELKDFISFYTDRTAMTISD